MKTLFLSIVSLSMLVPATAKQDEKDQLSEDFGGFAPRMKFAFVVEEVVSELASTEDETRKSKIPRGFPNYKVGKKVRFKIGNKGHLIAQGTRIPYVADEGISNTYTKTTKGKKSRTDRAIVHKDAEGMPTGVDMTFVRIYGKPLGLKTYTLTYTLR